MTPSGSSAIVVALVTHDSLAHLERNLRGQIEAVTRLGSTLIVVDNASTDGTVEHLRVHGVEPLILDRNRGYAAAVNRAFAAAPGRDVMLLNPDVEVSAPEAIEALAVFLGRRPEAGVVGPRLVGSGGALQPSARRFPTLLAMIGSRRPPGAADPARRSYERYLAPSSARQPTRVDWVIGAAMLIRRAAYDAVGGWDERYFLYMEDADFCRRVARAGWGVYYFPPVSLPHGYARASSAAEAGVLNSAARRRHVVSLARFFAGDPRLLVRR